MEYETVNVLALAQKVKNKHFLARQTTIYGGKGVFTVQICADLINFGMSNE
ncbi:hypothetical protein [Lactobacillus acetotolerans]|jgi:hypothetical protein|uniref:hypothetical protein n=1 Tax=Lactobacillus acetotolerans TaxID=1600 RepID=UPI002FDE202F